MCTVYSFWYSTLFRYFGCCSSERKKIKEIWILDICAVCSTYSLRWTCMYQFNKTCQFDRIVIATIHRSEVYAYAKGRQSLIWKIGKMCTKQKRNITEHSAADYFLFIMIHVDTISNCFASHKITALFGHVRHTGYWTHFNWCIHYSFGDLFLIFI